MATENTQENQNRTSGKKSNYAGYLGIFWTLFFGGLAFLAVLLIAASSGFIGDLPKVQDLENPNINVASEIYSADGKLIDKFETEKRYPVKYEDLPKNLVDALLAKEDIRFYDHAGVDFKALARAVFRRGTDGGGSTITQQLAKLLYTGKVSTNIVGRIKQKILEMITAVQLERLYTKEEIIAMYFNKVDFIYGANGIEMAAKTYFNKSTKDLNLAECATIVAMLENPVANNPHRSEKSKANSFRVRNVVLNQMVKYKMQDSLKIVELKKSPTPLRFSKINRNLKDTYSAYFKLALKQELQQWLVQYEKESGKKVDLYRDGLQIHLTIDSRMQTFAEDAMKKHLKGLQSQFFREQRHRKQAPFYNLTDKTIESIMKRAMMRTGRYKNLMAKNATQEQIEREFNTPTRLEIFTWNGIVDTLMTPYDSIRYHKHIFNSGLMSMNPTDGSIKAWVGGINWRYFQYDHVKQGKRQVGSTFKPLVYATAISQLGYTPCHTILNTRFCEGSWCPGNAGYPYTGAMSIRNALANSVNSVAARLIAATGPTPVIQLARDMGVTNNINKDYTIALGSSDLSLYEMVGVYSTFVNGGVYVKPEMIARVEDKNGETIRIFDPETREVMNEDVAYTMVDLLRGVVQMGTGKVLRSKFGFGNDVGGKTGTTNDNSDGWYMGITPKLVTGVWVGCEDRSAHFLSTAMGQGAVMAMPIWAHYMNSVYGIGDKLGVLKSDKFIEPKGINERWDCGSLRGFNTYEDYTLGGVTSGRATQRAKASSGARGTQKSGGAQRSGQSGGKPKTQTPSVNEQHAVEDAVNFDN
ncbi:MAG: peptidoglycan glycosyltransferase [Flavobacteriaceae bacterium]|nr:MAG: peptidoglycan glycosyltransferase [Flavobacteriaceae bacterium]